MKQSTIISIISIFISGVNIGWGTFMFLDLREKPKSLKGGAKENDKLERKSKK